MRERNPNQLNKDREMSAATQEIYQLAGRQFEKFLRLVGAHRKIYSEKTFKNRLLILAAYADGLLNGISPTQTRIFIEKGASRVSGISERKSSRASDVKLMPVNQSV